MRTRDRRINLMIAVESLHIGGAEIVIQRIAQTIDQRLFNLTICCMKTRGLIGDSMAQEGFEIIVLDNPENPRVRYLTTIKLVKLLRSRRIDIIHTHTTDAFFEAAACTLVLPRVRLVHTFHFGNYPHITFQRKWMEGISSRFADCLVAVGNMQREQLRATYGFRKRPVLCVWNGVSVAAKHDGRVFRKAVGVENHVLIGVTATMILQKGLFDFLKVARRFRDEGDRVRFVVVGEGPLRAQLNGARRELDLEETVVFTGCVEHASEIAVPAFDVFFQPSLWEAMSIALLEAMAAGKPVVASRVGEAPYIVEDGQDGLLVDPGDIDGMTAALRQLVDDPGLRSRLGKAASEKATRQFTVKRMTRAYEEIYQALMGDGPLFSDSRIR
jgi:glycosyltransferase involved in cell wall biosynthesis